MKSLRISPMSAAAVVALLAPLPALAQNRAVVFSARGGGFSALNNLNEAGTADFKTGFYLGGGGAVTFHRRGTSGVDKTKGFGRFGAGLEFQIPRSNRALYGQGDGFLYKVSNFDGGTVLTGFDKTQVDVVYSAGLSYRLPF